MSCLRRPDTSRNCGAACSTTCARLRLRAGDAAAAGAPESLLSGTGRDLDLKTFKLVDQLSGRTLGVRADTTPQVARIDAHLLNRAGVTRLCYCGPVLHTRPSGLQARASRCSSAPRSTATPGSRPTWKCRIWRSTPARAGLDGDAGPRRCARICGAAGRRCRRSAAGKRGAGSAGGQGRGGWRLTPAFDGHARSALLALPALYGDGCSSRRPASCCHRMRRFAGRAGRPRLAGESRGRRTQRCRSASTWPTWAATPTTAVRACRDLWRLHARSRARGRPLRRGRRGVRPQPPGGGLQPDLKELAERVPGAAQPASVRPGARRRAAPPCAACASRAKPCCACCRARARRAGIRACDRELVAGGGQWAVRAVSAARP